MNNAKADLTTKIYDEIFDVKENHFNVNREVKAVIINFGDNRGGHCCQQRQFRNSAQICRFHQWEERSGTSPNADCFSRR